MKHINNLIEWLQTDSHGKQSATRDHHGTKSRELPDNPRLYRYPCATLALPLRYVAMIFAVLVMSMANVGMAWGAEVTFTGSDLSVPHTIGSITLSVPGSSPFAYSNNKLSAGGAGYHFILTASSATISQVVIYTDNNNNRFAASNITNCTDCTSESISSKRVYTCTFNTPQTEIDFKNNGGGVGVTSLEVTYTASGGGDVTPPTLSSSTPANGATDVAVSGNITLTFSENVTINDASKFTLSGGAGTLNTTSATASGTVVTIPYSGLANNTTYTLATAAEAVKDGSNNKNAALSNISFTTVAGGGGTTVTATWPMYSGNSLSLVGTASNSSITPSNAVATFPSNIAWGAVATVTYTDYTGKMVKITENNTSNITGDNSSISYTTYVKYSLTVATGYTFKPTGFSARIGRQGTDNGCAKVVLKKGTTGIDSTTISKPSRDNASTLVASTTYSKLISDADTYEAGDVIDLYVYLGGKMKNKSFVISDVSITGEYAEAATPSCTAPSSVAISGTSSYLPGQNISLTAAATGGSGTPTTYQWYHRGVAIDGATSATYTKSKCTIDDAGNYTCKVTMGGSCSTTSPNFAVRVYSVKVWSNGGGSVIGNYPLTYQSSNNGRAVISTLSASTTYEFKVIDNVGGTSDSTIYYGNGGTIHHNTAIDPATWDFGSTTATNCKLVTGVETGDFTFDVDITHNGTGAGFYVTVNVAYPTKTIYLTPGVWNADGAKFAIHYYDANGGTGWTDFLTANDCGMSAEIPVWDGVKMIAGRFNSTKASTGNWDDKWNQTNDITVSSYNSVVITGWNESDYTYNSNFSTPTYTISYAKGGTTATGGAAISGSKASESKTCGVDFTLPSSAVFTATGYTQVGWTTSDGGAQEYALGGTYITNEDKTFYPVWTANQYTVTHTLDGVTKSSGATGANAATYGTNYTAEFAASSGYALPETITVTIGGSTKTAGTEYTWDQGTGTVVITGSYITGNIVITVNGESDSPCVIPSALTNEIARFQVPCDVDRSAAYNVTNEPYGSTNTYTTASFGGDGSSTWYYDETTGLSYGKMTSSSGLTITIKLNTGNFQAGDVVYVYSNRNEASKGGVKVGSTNKVTIGVSSTAAGVEASGSYTLLSTDIEGDGTLKFYREGSNSFINRIIVTRPACTNVSITTQPTTPVAATVGSACSITGLVAAGTSPTYQWYTCNSDGSSATAINAAGTLSFTGYNTATLGLTPTATGATYYKCVVSGSCGDPVTSSVVTVNASAAPASALVTYDLNVGTSASTSIGTSGTSTDPTNITSIAISQANAAGDGAGASNRTTKLPLATGENAASVDDPDKYVLFTFNVACGKKLTPSEVKIKVANVGSSAGGNQNYKAVLSDTYGHSISNTFTGTKSDGSVEEFSITNGGGTYFQGDVTLKLWSCKGASGNASAFRMGTPVEIYGAIGNQATPAATITWNTQPANGRVGDPDFAYDVTCSDGSTVTVTSANTTYATIVGGKLHYAAAGTTHLVATATDACGNVVVQNSSDFTVSAAAPTYSVTHNLTNVTATSGATGASAATEGVAYNAVFAASSGYVLPSTITVTIGGSPATAGTGYTWNSSTGAFQVPAAQVTGDIVITIAGETASASECVTITAFSTSSPTTISQSPFVRSNTATGDDSNTYLMWGQHAGSDFKGENSGAYMLLYYNTAIRIFGGSTSSDLFSNVTSVSFKWRYNSASSSTTTTLKVYVGSTQVGTAAGYSITGTKNDDFATISITELNQLSGYIQIVQSGGSGTGAHLLLDDIEICTSNLPACTTPVLPDLTKKTVCEGGDADAAWNAAITNSLATGETVAYSWVKKGSSTVLSSVATYQPTDVTEAMAGTYVVTATVSADGKASKSASKEVELSVNATVEISSVTQSPATVYAGNSVTLTATANVSATWQWYTCTNAEGDGESSIGSATSAAYAFTAPASAGTYYYKVKATGPCGGVATEVYALTVSAASAGCSNMVIFDGSTMSSAPASSTGTESTSGAAWELIGTATEMGGSISMTNGGKTYTKGWKFVGGATSSDSRYIKIVIPSGYTGDLVLAGYIGSTSRSVFVHTSATGSLQKGIAYWSPATTNTLSVATATLEEGTYYVCATNASYLTELSVNICSTVTCTDPAVTASVSKSNVCAGSGEGVTFTASDAHADASYQWQKQNGSTWDDISGATAATYTIATVEASHAGKYRVVASHECDRISNELTLTVATTPVFGDLGSAREVETGGSLSITDVEATSATSYKWYKSANATYDSGSDEQVGTSKNLMLPVNETAGSTFYLFCVASNACTSTVSSAITVNVIAPVEKDCAVGTSNGENFTTAKTSSVSSGTYNGQTELHMSSNNKYLSYIAASGYHFETATVNCCAGDATALTKAAYSYSTDGGETWTDADLPGAMTNQYTDHVVNLPANVNAFRVGRVLNGKGVGSNTLYVHQVCFTYVADCNATTITVSNASPTYDLAAGSDFTEPTCTVKQGSTTLSPQPALRYSSFNEAIATVDPSTGEVDFTGTAGSVMIMASYDGDETYCESSATYTITVSCGSESAPKIVAGSGTNLSGCNAEVNLVVKDQNGNDFASGSYQWYRDGEEIDGANSATYTANRTGTYTVSHTGVCTQMSTNSAVVTSESFDPSVERLVPFQYYHANKDYTDQMKMRHLFAVTSGGDYEGKRYYMTATRNGAPLDITTSTAFSVRTSIDNRVDSVMIDLNKLKGKFNAGDEIVLTCAAIADCGTISAVTENIEIHVIDNTPTLALICSGTNKSAGTRKTSEMTVGGDFLTGYNKADLCEQTGNTSFDANTEWGLYTRLKENYIVTPVNGYAVFNKLNYEPFDILLLTDYPKASKSTEAALILDDMYELCDYRPMLSFKTHMVQPADKLDGRDSHWKKKGFTTLPEAITKGDGRLKMNIVCYAHPMFEEITEGAANDYDDESQIVYTMLSGPGHEGSKGMQGFHLAAAENFVTIGLVHYNATATDNYDGSGNVKWTPESDDEMLVAAAERQTNLEARFILFSLNCGAQSKLTAQGNTVVLKCLEYLLNDATIEGNVADCALTFDNKAGDHKWSNKANWAPKYSAIPGEYNSTLIAAPATVDLSHAKVMSVRIKEGGSIYIPAGSALDVKSTVRHKDVGSDVRPTDVDEIHIGSDEDGNGTLIFNNNTGDTKARVDMYSTAKADMENMSAATSVWQYIGTPHTDVVNARSNYYGSWLYQYVGGTWDVIPNGGPLEAFRGYCITNETAPIVYDMEGTLAATTTQDIAIPDGYTVIANSWTAPIDISTFTDDDMENISDKTIYFFNTGTDSEGNHGTGTEAGTYVAVPKNSASYVGTWQIPSMQGFYISTATAGTLHLDYDRHVRPHSARTIVSHPMYAPRRAAAESDEPNVLKIFARGSRYQDKLVVLEREDFTRGYDSGWDGEAWGGGKFSPMVYVTGEGREDAVSAIPEFEGTVIAFKAGEDNDYHFDFIYDGEESLYLFDTENNTYTQIMTGESYYFSTDDKAPHSRFILTRRGPQIATGVEPTSDSSLKGRAKKLLIENKMYILLNGALYDATGKAVK